MRGPATLLGSSHPPSPSTDRTQRLIVGLSRTGMSECESFSKSKQRVREFERISKQREKKKLRQKTESHLDTVPVTLSPLCGANVVASRSSSNFL